MNIINPQKIFGESVKASRNLLGISQETLAERSELHRTYISDVERGSRNPTLKTILRLAAALEVSVSTLMPPGLAMENGKAPLSVDPERDCVDILLVEDEADDVELTLRAFEKARFANRVDVVSDGQVALDYLFFRNEFAHRKPAKRLQVILLDLSLPKMSGLEVLSVIKADKRTQAMPVVVLTGSNDIMHIAACEQLGVISYINKPFDWQGFGTAVKKLNLDWLLLNPREPFNRLQPSM
jgi:CheY-like chemotaxis protein/DNA-binding XRE family transcriptional regulator